MRLTRKLAAMAVAVCAFASLSFGHYHFVHFDSRSAPWHGVPEKFDLSALPNNTLTYFVTDQTGVQLSPVDSYAGLISEIRAAAKVWNDVESSDLRLAFGGLAAPRTPQSAPSLEIVFEDVPPGLIAAGGPEVNADFNGQFVPILKSVVMIRPDLSNRPSFSEKFFGTLVHEIGHGLGLQHTFTSGVMATSITRSTSRSKPLTSDDVAGISLLYPAPKFLQNTGSISGRVTMSGAGVNLASVVAISPNGAAISTLTNPDGTYRIDGLPQRQYFIYVHPLPPAQQGQATPGDIVFPKDSDGRELGPSSPFFTVFYPGTNDPSRALTVFPEAGSVVENINFAVRQRSGYGIHSVDTYAYPGQMAVKPPYLSPNIQYPFIVAAGSGLFSGNSLAQGLSVRVLGGATLSVRPYSQAPTSYAQIDFDVRTLSFSVDSPRHLVFSQNGDIYVLPAAFFHVEKLPPSISSVIPVTDGSQRLAAIGGSNLSEASRVFFDGVPAVVREFDALGNKLIVAPPAAPANHRASVIILNPDGQSSLFLQGDTPSTYTYFGDGPGSASTSPGSLTASPSSLPAAAEAMLQIDTTNGLFIDGQTVVGFGNSDIVVRQTFVASPTRLLVNVAVSPNAQTALTNLTIVSGLQVLTQPFAFQITPGSRSSFWLSGNIMNAGTGAPGVSAGSQAVVSVGNSPVTLGSGNTTLYLNDRSVPITSLNGNQIFFQVPQGTQTGGAILRVEVGGERSLPILMIVDPPPPRILSVVSEGEPPSTFKPGQLVTVTVKDLQSAGSAIDTSRIEVSVGGVAVSVAQVLEQRDAHRVMVYVPEGAPVGDELPLTVSIDSRTSDPIPVSVEE
jgi:hypothetical protein